MVMAKEIALSSRKQGNVLQQQVLHYSVRESVYFLIVKININELTK